MKIKLLSDRACPPRRAHPYDAGADLYVPADYTVTRLDPGARLTIPLGISMELPQGWVGLVCPRSGLASKSGVTVLNAPGIIDHGYTGEVKVVLYNAGMEPFDITPLSRVAQLVLQEVKTPLWEIMTEDGAVTQGEWVVATRGTRGFGSTG